ncbi:MAG: VanZ family protein [Polaribacter sp.]|jgi:VanZ family protein|nr:VanZ family protein [Polaribacter sp.]
MKNLFKDNFFLIAAFVITIVISCLSLIKTPKIDTGFSNIDKLYHLFAYFTLSLFWLFSFYKKSSLKYFIVLACLIYGILIEVIQHTLTTYRTGDYKDAIANTLGSIFGLIVFNQIKKKIDVN